MYRIQLTAEQTTQLKEKSRDRKISGKARDRLEMVRLSNAGWPVSRIAEHLGYCEQTVRRRFQAFLKDGFNSLADKARPGRARRVTEEHLAALEQLLDAGGRTWTAPQLSAWLCEQFQVSVCPSHIGKLLKRRHFRYKRTKTGVQHKADEHQQEVKAAELAAFKKSGGGRRDRPVLS